MFHLTHEKRRIESGGRPMDLILMRPRTASARPMPGILWIHGGGYTMGMAKMVYYSAARLMAKYYGAVVLSPEYRLAKVSPFPAALEDCYAALEYLAGHAGELGVDPSRIIVGGESAGGGLAAALCLLARDRGEVPVAFQFPLYPMLDCRDTPSSRDNHGRGWNTQKNHRGWQRYLGDLYGTDRVSKYASAARETDYSGLPPCYTFVADGEPFLDETVAYARHLREAGVEAEAVVYHGNLHGFDLLRPWWKESKKARRKLLRVYEEKIVSGSQDPPGV